MSHVPATPESAPAHDPYAALRLRDFRYFLTGSFVAWMGLQMQTVAVAWEVKHRVSDEQAPLMLGLVGLAQVVPVLALALPAGHTADRFDRRKILLCAETLLMCCSIGLALLAWQHGPLVLIYATLFLVGIGRAFQGPAKSALMPRIVPREIFSNAVTWNSSGFQLAAVLGPGLGGLAIWLLGSRTAPVLAFDAFTTSIFIVSLLLMRAQTITAAQPAKAAPTLHDLAAGFAFVRRNGIIFASITLDMFAVLLGGAVSLLSIYADDILKVGSQGFGWLYAAPAIGALAMSMVIAHRPPMQRAGRSLLWAVAGFGAATIVFGLSPWFWLSMAMLFLTGAFDNISVVVRHTLVQTLTPDAMRGRVSAVNGMFISASNELGAFESGLVAWLFSRVGDPKFGPTMSVVLGGVGTLVVVAIVAVIWPQLRRFGALDGGHDVNPVASSAEEDVSTPV